MKINIAAGKQTWPDFYCIDAVPHPKATRPLDCIFEFKFIGNQLQKKVPLADGCATEVHCYHYVEHVYQWQAPALVREFNRLLQPGGILVLELPDLTLCARSLLKGDCDQRNMWGLYGDPGHRDEFMCHRWGWTTKTLTALLQAAGFQKIKFMDPKTHGARVYRDMRCEAIKT